MSVFTLASGAQPLKLWLLSSGLKGWDTYDQILVAAYSEAEARDLNPYGDRYSVERKYWDCGSGWASDPEKVMVREIGVACCEPGVIMASYHAG